jgi:hypothetical protein
MQAKTRFFAALAPAVATTAAVLLAGLGVGAQERKDLRPVSAFAGIGDERARSVALFGEAGKVITHPRCVNCHPVTDRPLQGETQRQHPHSPRVVRGEAGMGVPGLACTTCHGPENVRLVATSLKSVPGHPKWQLAPIEMAWEGQTLGAICEQIKDPQRNGGRDLAAMHEHMAKDDLVGWGWKPGEGREPAPGTQEAFGALIGAWIETGAHCPDPARP